MLNTQAAIWTNGFNGKLSIIPFFPNLKRTYWHQVKRLCTCMLFWFWCLFSQMGGDPGISAFPEEDNIFCWKGTITGSEDTVFEGTEYRLSLAFSNDYPFKPPKIKFETCCFHPNVDLYGNICLDILQVHYKSFLLLLVLLVCYWLIPWSVKATMYQRSSST